MVAQVNSVSKDLRRICVGDWFELGLLDQSGVAFARSQVVEVPDNNTFRAVMSPNTKPFRCAQVGTNLYVRRTHPTGVYLLKTVVVDKPLTYQTGLLLKHEHTWEHVQRRKAQRLPIQGDEARIVNAYAIDDWHQKLFEATLVDIGELGLCLRTADPVEWCEMLQVEIAFSKPSCTLTLDVQVLHKSRRSVHETGSVWQIGGKFTGLSSFDRNIIKEFIMHQMADRYISNLQPEAPSPESSSFTQAITAFTASSRACRLQPITSEASRKS